MVNGHLVARGEAMVVNDKFGVRITDIVRLSERIARSR
jgi:flagellar motor switch protein FliN/FliY